MKTETSNFVEEIKSKWNEWQNLKLKKLIIVLSSIIVFIGIGVVMTILDSKFGYTKMCNELMGENKEVVSQLNTLDPNSAEWNSLYTQTENENPQLIECIYPSDSNN